ncbi:MAG: FixH family protein [Verrucomicrobiota bacterium]|nr:FixH family protein [Verrucomicrobiota bacterium]
MKRNPWPCAIIGYFILFISGIIYWVTFAIRNDDQLVRPDYYAHEITYQKQIDRVSRTLALGGKITIAPNATHRNVLIQLPEGANEVEGTIHFYRPSNEKLDRRMPLKTSSNGMQKIDISTIEDGFWKIRVEWQQNGQEYFFEQPLLLKK